MRTTSNGIAPQTGQFFHSSVHHSQNNLSCELHLKSSSLSHTGINTDLEKLQTLFDQKIQQVQTSIWMAGEMLVLQEVTFQKSLLRVLLS